jgi:hypothetical protein
MKFNVEIDLDWVEEDSTIDEVVKHQIISNIEGRILKTLQETVLNSAKAKIDAQIQGLITQNVHKMVSEKVAQLIAEPRSQTDAYGRVVKENFTIESLLIEGVESAVNKKTLNESGNFCSDSYNQKYSYFDYYTTKTIPSLVDKQIKALTEKTTKDIEALVKDKIKTEVADKLTALIVENSTALSLRSDKPKV